MSLKITAKQSLLICTFTVGLISGPLLATPVDDLRDALKNNIDHSNIGAGYVHILTFFTEPDISSSFYSVDDDTNTDFNIYKFPFQKTFNINDKGWKSLLRGTVSYASLDQNGEFLPDETIAANWKAYSGSVGSGILIPLNHNLSFLAAADIGYSHLESNAKYHGDILENILAPVLDGIAYNWDTNAWIVGGTAGLGYKKAYDRGYLLDIKGSYTYNYITSFSESVDLPAFSDSTNTLSLKMDFTHPLGKKLANFPLYGVAHLGNVTFIGNNRDALGFNYFFEAGYSFKLDVSSKYSKISAISLGYQWSKGDNVSGHTILFSWDM